MPPNKCTGVFIDLLQNPQCPKAVLTRIFRQEGDNALVRNLARMCLDRRITAAEFESDEVRILASEYLRN